MYKMSPIEDADRNRIDRNCMVDLREVRVQLAAARTPARCRKTR